MDDFIKKRIARATGGFEEHGIDSLLVLSDENRFYLSGFTAADGGFDESAGALLVTADRLVLLTDSRYELQAIQEAPLYEVVCYKGDFSDSLSVLIGDIGVKRMGIETGRIPHAAFVRLSDTLSEKGLNIEMVDATPLLKPLRASKEKDELDRMARTLEIAEKAFEQFLEQDLAVGVSEKQAAWALEKRMRDMGADSVSFPVIAAFGTNSALPHAVCGSRTVRPGVPLLFDWGAKLDGYCSDTTRSFVLGECDTRYKKVYATVYEAQQKAIEAIKPGVSARQVDSIAREHIEQAGFKGRFGHGLGHGVGIAIHEFPSVSPLSDAILEEAMVVTVEPGIYIPEWGGVRLENMVVVRPDSAQVLNRLESGNPEIKL